MRLARTQLLQVQPQDNFSVSFAADRVTHCFVMHAAPLKLNLSLLTSTAVHYPEEENSALQLNIFCQDSRHFEIISEVRCNLSKASVKDINCCMKQVIKLKLKGDLDLVDYAAVLSSTTSQLPLQNGDITYHLHKVKTFSPFSASEWQLSDGSKTSPGTIIIRKSPFSGHVSFERRDGTLIADMGTRLMMTGSEFCWGGNAYRYLLLC